MSVRNSSFRMKYKIIVDIKANENKNYLYQPASHYFVNTVDGWEAVLWVRIRMDPHHFGNLDPDTHQVKILIRIKVIAGSGFGSICR